MSFASPAWLAALTVIPLLLAAYVISRRRRQRYMVRFTALPALRVAAGPPAADWKRYLPAALLLGGLAALALALARPHQAYSSPINEASVMLVIDDSGSMDSTDVSPTRLQAAQHAADTFISKMPAKSLVGTVGFSSAPNVVQAPITDHGAVQAMIDQQVAGGSTATGAALNMALQLLHGNKPKHPPSAIVLLSDGAANAGEDPISAARQAKAEHIPVYTIALGTPTGTLANPDPFGAPVPVPPDPQLMAQIAETSGGRTFTAQSSDVLNAIYQGLGKALGSVTRHRDVTAEFAIAGVVLVLLAAAGATRWSGRLP
jgi:Ca-activated chloride channel family protein